MPQKVTEEQFLDAVWRVGPHRQTIADELGLTKRGVQFRLQRLIAKGKLNADWDIPNYQPGAGRRVQKVTKQLDKDGNPRFYSVVEKPETDEESFVPALAKPARVSTLRGADGRIIQQWEITKPEENHILEQVHEAVDALKDTIPLFLPTQPPVHLFETGLTNLYVLSDAHIGSLAWKPETGVDWDLKIAEETLTRAFQQMILSSPKAQSCLVVLLGDWLHYDKLEAVTTLSNNILDSDGRRNKMIKVAIRVARQIIAQALAHHHYVDVLIAEGNHDIIGSAWLRELFMVAFEQEPRVRIIEEERPYYAVKIGDVFLGFHHGHLKGIGKKNQPKTGEELVAIFADEFAPLWGTTKKRYIHTGHLHFAVEGEPRGARVIQHPTLAARDGWAARMGYGPLREARAITYHERFGQAGMVNVSPEMVIAA